MNRSERESLQYALNIWERNAGLIDDETLKGIGLVYQLLSKPVPYKHYYSALLDISDPFITYSELKTLQPCEVSDCLWCVRNMKELEKWYER